MGNIGRSRMNVPGKNKFITRINDGRPLFMVGFSLILLFSLFISLVYLYNIIKWADTGDRGFYFRSTTGIQTVGIVTKPGDLAGIKVGDRVLKVNGHTFSSLKDFFDAMDWDIGGLNTYLVERDGRQYQFRIPITRQGFKVAFTRSGPYFLAGLCYLFIGSLVFLMRPQHKTSWIFFVSCAVFGSLITFFTQLGEVQPSWLGTVHIFLYTLSPATFIHLAMYFPEKKTVVEKHPYIEFFPYLGSAILFAGIRSSTEEVVGISKEWFLVLMAYFIPALIVFLASCLYSWQKSASEAVKVRSKLILLGAGLTASLPIADMLSNTLWNIYIVPSYNYYIPFLLIFPIFSGYAIIKHNLFDIDATIRRTFGHILTGIAIACFYTMVILVPTLVIGQVEVLESHVFLFVFFLFIILIFNLVRNPLQRFIDRFFFRLEYDYYDTVQRIGESMRSLMSLKEIGVKILRFIEDALFIEKGSILIADQNGIFEAIAGEASNPPLKVTDPLVKNVMDQKRAVHRYDIEENFFFRIDRTASLNAFDRLGATLVLPIIFESQLIGLISLGRKKSGKFYRFEDINLLTILANQAGIAITNARLHQSRIEALENSRREIDQLSKAKGKALDHLSHELSTPVSLIRANVKRLQKTSLKENNGSADTQIYENILRQVNRLSTIQEQAGKIINYHSKKELSDSVKESPLANLFEEKAWPVMPLIENLVVKIRRIAPHRSFSIQLNGEAAIHSFIKQEIIEDFLYTLMKNAIENTPDEGLIRILWQDELNYLLLCVQDFGIGITEENRPFIFGGLFHTEATELYSSKRPFDFNAGGNGLDLYRLKVLSNYYGFDLSVSSRRCAHIKTDMDVCPGRVSGCSHCKTLDDCQSSGGSEFWGSFPIKRML